MTPLAHLCVETIYAVLLAVSGWLLSVRALRFPFVDEWSPTMGAGLLAAAWLALLHAIQPAAMDLFHTRAHVSRVIPWGAAAAQTMVLLAVIGVRINGRLKAWGPYLFAFAVAYGAGTSAALVINAADLPAYHMGSWPYRPVDVGLGLAFAACAVRIPARLLYARIPLLLLAAAHWVHTMSGSSLDTLSTAAHGLKLAAAAALFLSVETASHRIHERWRSGA